MALAWLDLVGVDHGALRFAIDTGTSRYYQLKVGRSRTRREGIDQVDEVYLTTPVSRNEAGGSLLPATREVRMPASRLDRGDAYVQLVTYKAPDGRGPAFSQVLPLPSNAQSLGGRIANLEFPMPVSASMTLTQAPFQPARKIPCVSSPDEYAREQSIDDILSSILKVAGPVVLQMLGSGAGGGGASGAAGAGAGGESSPITGVVTYLLKTLLAGMQPAAQPGAAAAGAKPTEAISKGQSLGGARLGENRFTAARRTQWSRPFIFGIDDALIGTMIGPLLNILPQLANAANQQRLQLKQTDNKLVTDALAQVNQRMLMEQLLQAQQKASGDQQAELAQLKALLAQAAAAMPDAKTQSLSLSAPNAPNAPSAPYAPATAAATPSQRSVLSFVAADPLDFNGTPRLLLVRDHDVDFKVRLTVGDPVPKSPLPRAILTLTFKGGHHPADWVTSSAKLTNVAANGVVSITVSRDVLARLPAQRKIPVIAELRWPGSQSRVAYSATGTTDIVLVDRYFVRQRGGLVGEERELTDMSQYRSFWNKVWEAPALDAVNRSNVGRAKSLWELDVNARYMVLLTPHEAANGVMETKISSTPPDPDDLRLKVDGRLKGGVELSMSELNKLCSLWDGQAPLDADHLAAMQSPVVARANSGEFISSIKLKGRAGERGLVWVVPVFQLVEFTLSSVQKTDDAGQVIAVGEEKIRFPMPVSARVLGLKSAT